MIHHTPILFHGSKERLQRITERSNGIWFPERKFEITMESRHHKEIDLCFRFRCIWESHADSIQISYRIIPTIPTILIPLAAFLFFIGLGILIVTGGSADDWPVFLIPALAVVAWLHRLFECIRDFRKLFTTPAS